METIKASKDITEKILKEINQILKSPQLNIEDKKNIYKILVYVLNRSLRRTLEPTIKIISEFCLNSQINNRKFFSNLLNDISSNVQKSIDNKEDDYRCLDLIDRIYTICNIALNSINIDDDILYGLLNKALNSNVVKANHEFIRKILKNNILNKNIEKQQIAIEVFLTKSFVTTVYEYDSIWDILTNDDILSFANEKYKKAVEIGIGDGVQAYIFNKVMKKTDLTLEKRKLIIDYYYEIFNKYPFKYICCSIERYEQIMKAAIVNIVYCDNLIEADEKMYIAVLDFIKNSEKPFSYAKIFASKNISEEQRGIALEMLSKGKIVEFKSSYDYYERGDCDDLIVSAATSPILTTFSDSDYQKILSIIYEYNEKRKSVSEKQALLYQIKAGYINEFLENEKIFQQNIERLLIAIEQVVLSSEEMTIRNLANFSLHENSIYYTNSEYRKILEMIRNGAPFSSVQTLLTNENLPFTENKNELFKIIEKEPEEKITNLAKELNTQGFINKYMYHIFNGIDEDTMEQIIESKIKIKEYVLPYQSKQN